MKPTQNTQTNPSVIKMTNRLVKWFKVNYPKTFKTGEYSIKVTFTGPSTSEVTINCNRYLGEAPADKKEFELIEKDLLYAAQDIAEATKATITESYYGGDLTHSLIKPGAIIKADALLSHITVLMQFPINFKR